MQETDVEKGVPVSLIKGLSEAHALTSKLLETLHFCG